MEIKNSVKNIQSRTENYVKKKQTGSTLQDETAEVARERTG
jgi:hypothetical protein